MSDNRNVYESNSNSNGASEYECEDVVNDNCLIEKGKYQCHEKYAKLILYYLIAMDESSEEESIEEGVNCSRSNNNYSKTNNKRKKYLHATLQQIMKANMTILRCMLILVRLRYRRSMLRQSKRT